jgi:hypothetical protein
LQPQDWQQPAPLNATPEKTHPQPPQAQLTVPSVLDFRWSCFGMVVERAQIRHQNRSYFGHKIVALTHGAAWVGADHAVISRPFEGNRHHWGAADSGFLCGRVLGHMGFHKAEVMAR